MATLKSRYASALIELSEAGGTLEKDIEQAVLLRQTLSDPEVQAFLQHPDIPHSEKERLFQNAFSENLSDYFKEVLFHMVSKNQSSLIVPTLDEYIERSNRRLGRIDAKVVSARPLTENQIETLRRVLSEKMQMQVEIRTDVDPDLIGGLYIMIGGYILDHTVRTELNNMKENLKRGSVDVSQT